MSVCVHRLNEVMKDCHEIGITRLCDLKLKEYAATMREERYSHGKMCRCTYCILWFNLEAELVYRNSSYPIGETSDAVH